VPPLPPGLPPGDGPETTGRYLVLMRADAMAAAVKALDERVGLKVARSTDFAAAEVPEVASGESLVFDHLAVAVVDSPPDQFQALGAAVAEESSILAIEPERIVEAIQDAPFMGDGRPLPVEYLRGYRDAVNELIDRLLGEGVDEATATAFAAAISEAQNTWGLQATAVVSSPFTGRGTRVAVLDTGFDLTHPDFLGRVIVSQSFVPGEAVQDGHGHGTHCIGTSCGPRRPGQLPRYGVAYEAEIYAGKVLSNSGRGTDSQILNGINWAIANKCEIVSMSLGAPAQLNQPFSAIFEQVAQRALAAGTLIIAAAGNESQRPGLIAPVGHPANCPSIIAVAALDAQGRIAPFSCGGLNLQGGQIDITGPGVAVRSSWPQPQLYRTISGTSMATPHVAGIAALFAESNPSLRGRALVQVLHQNARRLPLPSRDVGAGLAQAPQ
jgi:subtilisin family serine protease